MDQDQPVVAQALLFADWLTSAPALRRIEQFKVAGQQLFFPYASAGEVQAEPDSPPAADSQSP